MPILTNDQFDTIWSVFELSYRGLTSKINSLINVTIDQLKSNGATEEDLKRFLDKAKEL